MLINGDEVEKILVDGAEVQRVYLDGAVVWEVEGETSDFPVLRSEANDTTTGTTSRTMTFTGSQVGDLLMLILAIDGVPTVGGLGAWTVKQTTNSAAGDDLTGLVAYKVCGTAGESATVTLSASEAVAAKLLVFVGPCAAECSDLTKVAASSATANPPSLTVAEADNYWIAAVMQSGTGTSLAAGSPPAGYEFIGANAANGSTSGHTKCHAAGRELHAATEDPGSFGQVQNGPIMATIAVWSTA